MICFGWGQGTGVFSAHKPDSLESWVKAEQSINWREEQLIRLHSQGEGTYSCVTVSRDLYLCASSTVLVQLIQSHNLTHRRFYLKGPCTQRCFVDEENAVQCMNLWWLWSSYCDICTVCVSAHTRRYHWADLPTGMIGIWLDIDYTGMGAGSFYEWTDQNLVVPEKKETWNELSL